LIQQKKVAQGLAYLKVAAQANPDDLRFANDYRIALRDQGQFQEEEKFFSEQLKTQTTINLQLDLALSYVDEMRSCPKPPDGLVCQAQFSSRSISVLNTILQQVPYNIIARYARGLNDLYWPTLMGHLPQAQVDLQYAVALSQQLNAITNSFMPDAYTALGDVFAKDNKIDTARNVWLNGKQEIPDSSLLNQRLNIPRDQLVNQEDNAIRGLGVYVDTNITLFWQKER
jgi:tetratricopeptide (TPR) repeat protein